MNWQKPLWKLTIDEMMDFSLKTSYENHFNFRYYSNAMWVCFLKYFVFQMLMENDNAANVNNQWKIFICTSYKALRKWCLEKLARTDLLKEL